MHIGFAAFSFIEYSLVMFQLLAVYSEDCLKVYHVMDVYISMMSEISQKITR